jgi:hypothetical protein
MRRSDTPTGISKDSSCGLRFLLGSLRASVISFQWYMTEGEWKMRCDGGKYLVKRELEFTPRTGCRTFAAGGSPRGKGPSDLGYPLAE